MADRYPPRSSRDSEAELELIRLERPAGRGGGWRLAAVLVTVALVGVVIVGRLGMDDEPPAASPSPTAAAVSPTPSDLPQPSPVPAESAEPAASPRPTLPPSSDAIPRVARYLDGIPASLAGERIYRVDSALTRAGERLVLVGGWYSGALCERMGRCTGLLSDSPAAGARGQGLPVNGLVVPDDGALALRARVVDSCTLAEPPAGCGPSLNAVGIAWSGDLVTAASPIEVQPLMSALAVAFPDMRADPFQELTRCAMPWPPQTYRSVTGGPRMTLVFPTLEDRQSAEAEILFGWPRPPEGSQGQCLDQFMPLAEPAGWLAQDNVMLWLSERDDVQALARAALLDASTISRPTEAVVPAPITTWAALRALQRWEPRIEILPSPETVVWSPDGLPLGGALALSDPYVRLLLVFPTSAARRDYERSVDPGDVVVTSLRTTEPEILHQLEEIRAADVRWLGERNVLLQVNGPPGIDDELRAAIREVTRAPGR